VNLSATSVPVALGRTPSQTIAEPPTMGAALWSDLQTGNVPYLNAFSMVQIARAT
jgi:hypothetical protein